MLDQLVPPVAPVDDPAEPVLGPECRADRPVQLETPRHYFLQALTPNAAFFVRWHLGMHPRSVDLSTWKLRVEGHVTSPFAVDFATHARTMGASAEDVHSIAELKEAFARAQASKKTYVICLKVDAFDGWTQEGHTWWEIGTPSVSTRPQVLKAHEEVERGRKDRQRPGV